MVNQIFGTYNEDYKYTVKSQSFQVDTIAPSPVHEANNILNYSNSTTKFSNQSKQNLPQDHIKTDPSMATDTYAYYYLS